MTGVLFINLGTPESPRTKDVRKYLRQFLSDPLVIDINPVARWFLVNGIIAPFRAPKSAALYKKIWMLQGSPLLVYSKKLAQAVGARLGDDYRVELAMRYGKPSIESAVSFLIRIGVKKIKVLPLYPQYALSSTQSSIDEVVRVVKKRIFCEILPPFYNHPGYLTSFAERGKNLLEKMKPDHVLFSYHGLPKRHICKTDATGNHCFKTEACCDQIGEANKNCYRAQCMATTHSLARLLNISQQNYTMAFQSRLGRTPWIKPYTDKVLPELVLRGKKSVAVFCPSFVADCLETLEEVALRNRDLFLASGGEKLTLVPSLNDSPRWVEAVCEMVRVPDPRVTDPR